MGRGRGREKEGGALLCMAEFPPADEEPAMADFTINSQPSTPTVQLFQLHSSLLTLHIPKNNSKAVLMSLSVSQKKIKASRSIAC